ncbi:d2 protein [Proteus phage VTCCBPA139]|nr:d2 protein [Proteus phage VTCCBPA139]
MGSQLMARSRKHAHMIPDSLFKEAIEWLENGGTKVGARDILGRSGVKVSSNPQMEKLIEEWQANKELDKRMRAQKRGKPIEGVEATDIIERSLNGQSLAEIASAVYRSSSKVKEFLESVGADLRSAQSAPPDKPFELNPPLVPEAAMSFEFEVGEKVWVSAYQCFGEIMKKINDDVYRVYLLDEGTQQYVHQNAWNLGSLKHLHKFGIDQAKVGFKWTKEDAYPLLSSALEKAKKQANDDKKRK